MPTVSDTLETVMTLKGADSVVSGFTNLASKLLGASAAGDTLAGAQTNLAASQAALLAPLTVMLAETTQLTANLFGAVAGFGALAASEGVCAAATSVLDAALALLEAPLVIIVGLLATLTAGAILAGKALAAFSESEDTIARLAVRMRNLGNAFPIKELTAFSGKLGDQLGIDDELIAKLGAMAAGFGLNRQQIEKALPVVLDVAVANKVDPEEVLQRIFRASRGRTQGLIGLNIDPGKIKGDLHDVNNLIDQIGKGFAGTAASFRNSLPGTVLAFKASVKNLLEAIGRFLSPVVVGPLNLLITVMDALKNQLGAFADAVEGTGIVQALQRFIGPLTTLFERFFAALLRLSGPFLGLLLTAITRAADVLNRIADFLHLPQAPGIGGSDGSKIAFKGDPEQTEYQRQTAENTKSTLDAIVKSVIGGPGTLAKQAFTFRDSQMALKI